MDTDLLLLGAGIWLGALALLLLLWALFADRARGRRRCRKCWYDMTHVEGVRCPECGWRGRRERQFGRTRRRWGWAIVAVLLGAVSAAVAMTPTLRRNGIETVLPNSALVLAFDRLDQTRVLRVLGRRGVFDDSVNASVRRKELWGWQWEILADHLADAALDQAATTRAGQPVATTAGSMTLMQRLECVPPEHSGEPLARCLADQSLRGHAMPVVEYHTRRAAESMRPCLPGVIKCLDDFFLRHLAVRAVGRIGPPADNAIPKLEAIVFELGAEAELQQSALEALCSVDAEANRAIRAIERLLGSANVDAMVRALLACRHLEPHPDAPTEAIIWLFDRGDEPTKAAAVVALAHVAPVIDADVLRVFHEGFGGGSERLRILVLLEAVARVDGDEVTRFLEKGYADDDPDVRHAAVRAATFRADPALGRPIAFDALDDPAWPIRYMALIGLESHDLDRSTVRTFIVSLVDDDHPSVRAAALRIVRRAGLSDG